MDQEFVELELEVKSWGYRDADDFIRKNKEMLTERQLKLLQLINFDFRN
jgi:hypothetical protein